MDDATAMLVEDRPGLGGAELALQGRSCRRGCGRPARQGRPDGDHGALRAGASSSRLIRPTGSASDLPQSPLECFRCLATLDQMPVIQNDGRDGIDTLLGVEAFAGSYFRLILVGVQNLACAIGAQPRLTAQPDQGLVIAGIFAVREVRLQER